MAIQDEMYKMIEKEIIQKLENENLKEINIEKVKDVAKMLTSLSTEKADAEQLVNQYLSNIKNICK